METKSSSRLADFAPEMLRALERVAGALHPMNGDETEVEEAYHAVLDVIAKTKGA